LTGPARPSYSAPMPTLEWIAFDADDTLWHNERLFDYAQDRFAALLGEYREAAWIRERLFETETRNLAHFGYGIKAFALSMLETATELTEGRITGAHVTALLDLTKEMLAAKVELLPGVAETVKALAKGRRLLVITKGDLLDQQSKMERSGLAPFFEHVEVVSDKTAEAYGKIFARHGMDPGRLLMVGNSLRSDVIPALDVGAWAVHVPYETTWLHEVADAPSGHPRFREAASIDSVPEIVAEIDDIP